MKHFAALLDRLSYQPQRNAKLVQLADYFAHTPDPDRGYALAALTGALDFAHAKPAMIRELATAHTDAVLFGLSYDFVGDLAETVALIWPKNESTVAVPSLSEVIATLRATKKSEVPKLLAGWLDTLDATGRWALMKLLTGALRVGVSARLAKTALPQFGKVEVAEIEEVWHGLEPPYTDLFAWLTGAGPRPDPKGRAAFRPVMLAHALDETDLPSMNPADYAAEWKWDGVRIQIVGENNRARLYSRTGDEMTSALPDLMDFCPTDATLDGELLVIRDGVVAPFADLQKRLNRKTVSAELLRTMPVGVRLYDILAESGEDVRALPFAQRRQRLGAWFARQNRPRFDISAPVPFATWDDLATKRAENTTIGVEGLMLKRLDSPYVAGRPTGPWWKWKRDPRTADAVLMYAQRGHGKRSSYYSDYTFGVWNGADLVPVGKAYFGFTDEELRQIDRWVREHTTNKFGPVREVEPGLVFEVAFEGLQRSTRHKAGLAMRFPRISRIRWDKPFGEADTLETLERMLG